MSSTPRLLPACWVAHDGPHLTAEAGPGRRPAEPMPARVFCPVPSRAGTVHDPDPADLDQAIREVIR